MSNRRTLRVRLITAAVFFPIEPARRALTLGLFGRHVKDEFQSGRARMSLLEDGVALAIRLPVERLPRVLRHQRKKKNENFFAGQGSGGIYLGAWIVAQISPGRGYDGGLGDLKDGQQH